MDSKSSKDPKNLNQPIPPNPNLNMNNNFNPNISMNPPSFLFTQQFLQV